MERSPRLQMQGWGEIVLSEQDIDAKVNQPPCITGRCWESPKGPRKTGVSTPAELTAEWVPQDHEKPRVAPGEHGLKKPERCRDGLVNPGLVNPFGDIGGKGLLQSARVQMSR